MAHETIDGPYRQTNLANESPEYLAKREELRLAEIELGNQREKVAKLRRRLPPGAILEDYDSLKGRRPFYSVHPRLADDIDTRGIDQYNPIWNVLDLTPRGRGNWDASLDYGTEVVAARH